MYTLDNGIYAIIIAFVAGIIICPLMIPFLVRLKFGRWSGTTAGDPSQKIRHPHQGGLGIIAALVIGSVFFLKDNPDGAAVLIHEPLPSGPSGFWTITSRW